MLIVIVSYIQNGVGVRHVCIYIFIKNFYVQGVPRKNVICVQGYTNEKENKEEFKRLEPIINH